MGCPLLAWAMVPLVEGSTTLSSTRSNCTRGLAKLCSSPASLTRRKRRGRMYGSSKQRYSQPGKGLDQLFSIVGLDEKTDKTIFARKEVSLA